MQAFCGGNNQESSSLQCENVIIGNIACSMEMVNKTSSSSIRCGQNLRDFFFITTQRERYPLPNLLLLSINQNNSSTLTDQSSRLVNWGRTPIQSLTIFSLVISAALSIEFFY